MIAADFCYVRYLLNRQFLGFTRLAQLLGNTRHVPSL
jgi:hypothetical protein